MFTILGHLTHVFSFIRMPTQDVHQVIIHRELLTYVSVIPQEAMHRTRLTNAMETNPSSEANNHSAISEFPNILWNQNVHRQFHTSLPLVPVISQMNTVHTSIPRQ